MNWQGPADDKTCRLDDATLRVEQMDTDIWWWCLYNDKLPLGFIYGHEANKYSAKEAAEKAYKDHG